MISLKLPCLGVRSISMTRFWIYVLASLFSHIMFICLDEKPSAFCRENSCLWATYEVLSIALVA